MPRQPFLSRNKSELALTDKVLSPIKRRSQLRACGLLILLAPNLNAEGTAKVAPLSTQQPHALTEFAARLERNKPFEREIAAGNIQSYEIALAAGDFLLLSLERRGFNLYLTFLGPDGKKLIDLNRAAYSFGPIPLYFVSEVAGTYRLEIRLPAGETASARYRIAVDELRAATAHDRTRARAEWTFLEAQELSDHGSGQSHRKSIEKYEQALASYRAVGERHGEARTLNFIGWALSELGDHRKALEYYTQSLAISEALQDRPIEATVLNNLGLAYNRLSDSVNALEYFNRALPLRRAIGDRQGEAITLNNIGMAHSRMSEYRKAIGFLRQALPIYRAIGHRRLEAGLLYNIGHNYASLGEWQTALECFAKALPVARAVGNQRLEASILGATGAVYASLNEHQKALQHYSAALPLHRFAGNRAGEASALIRIGRINSITDETQKALDTFNQALAISRTTGDRRAEALAIREICIVYANRGDHQKAMEYLNQALHIARAAGNRDAEAGLLNDIGAIYNSLGEYQKALDPLNRALELYRGTGTPGNEAETLSNIARSHRGLGNLIEARSNSEAALRIVESQRGKVASPESRASYFESVGKVYDLDIDLLMQMHRRDPSKGFDTIAVETSERARARSLLDLLTEARADIREGVNPALLERERSIGELLSAKAERQSQLLTGGASGQQAPAAAKEAAAREAVAKHAAAIEIESLLSEYKQVQADIRANSPRYAGLTQPQPVSLKQIQQELLDSDTTLLIYSLGKERSYLWAVSAGSVTSHELSNRALIEESARRFYELTKTNSEDPASYQAAAELSRILIAPAAQRLQTKRLLIVPDGALYFVPFAALQKPAADGPSGTASDRPNQLNLRHDRPLIADHEIVVLPSLSVLAEIRRDLAGRVNAKGMLVIFADPVFRSDDPRLKSASRPPAASEEQLTPDIERAMSEAGTTEGFPRLPFSRREAESIAALAPAGQSIKALDFRASRETVIKTNLAGYRIIHFATHGLLNNRNPELSGIVLSLVGIDGRPQNGFLRLHEIYNLKMPIDLVVLSACQTALGKEIRGEGLIGLTRGFMYAGAARVVASLWKVDDAATAELMKQFYRGMLVKGLPPAAALRDAQTQIRRQARWRSPYYWAAFVLQGEWK